MSAAMLGALVVGVRMMNTDFINYDPFGCKHRKPTPIGLSGEEDECVDSGNERHPGAITV